LWFTLRCFCHSEHPGGGGTLLVLEHAGVQSVDLGGDICAGIYFRAIVELDKKKEGRDNERGYATAIGGIITCTKESAMTHLTKLIVAGIDGSENALNALDYLGLIYGAKHILAVEVLYVLPALPQILVVDRSRTTKMRLLDVEKKSIQLAGRILAEARGVLFKKGFKDEQIKTSHLKKHFGIARDICSFAGNKRADAVLISSRGRSGLETFFAGEVTSKMLEYCRICSLWIVEGAVTSKKVLIAMDSSENALRAAEYAGFMLSGTDCQVTLFHSKRHLRRFVPQEVIEAAPELEELWRNKAGEQIGPQMKKAKEMLLEAGLREDQITTKIVDGSRSAAADILKEVRGADCGTVVLGRRGRSGVKEFFMGSITSKVLQDCAGMAVWVVH
jgi:nucleotide-binding universal stress UspA family protein